MGVITYPQPASLWLLGIKHRSTPTGYFLSNKERSGDGSTILTILDSHPTSRSAERSTDLTPKSHVEDHLPHLPISPISRTSPT